MGNSSGKGRVRSAKSKVELLENAVLTGELEQVNEVIEEYKEFEFTARALGLACLYTNLDIVKTLVEAGASFAYPNDNDWHNLYKTAYTTKQIKYPANYSLMVSYAVVNNDIPFLYIPYLGALYHEFHFGPLRKDMKPNEEKTRADIAEYLLSCRNAKFDAHDALYHAILWGNIEVAERLKKNGVKLTKKAMSCLSAEYRYPYLADPARRSEMLAVIPALPQAKCLYALNEFNALLKPHKARLSLSQSVFESDRSSMFCSDVLKLVFSETDTSKLNKTQIIKKVIERSRVDELEALASAGLLKTKQHREIAISYATEQKKNDMIAWLMDFKNRTVDIATEEEKELKKMVRELSAAPDSATVMKKTWAYSRLSDSTVEITSYKGSETALEIPAKIGKNIVTSIGEQAFSASWVSQKSNKENKKRIISVVIPDTVTQIKNSAFRECLALEVISIPSGVKSIGDRAFFGCRALTAVTIPRGVVEIGEGAFCDCSSLTSICLPEGLKAIGFKAFSGCKALTEITIPQSVAVIGSQAFDYCHNVESLVLPDSFAPGSAYFNEVFRGCRNCKKYFQYGEWHDVPISR